MGITSYYPASSRAVNLVAYVKPKVHTFDYAIAATLQHLRILTALWPADPLCAPPHFATGYAAPEFSLPPSAQHLLGDLTNLMRKEFLAFRTSTSPLPKGLCSCYP